MKRVSLSHHHYYPNCIGDFIIPEKENKEHRKYIKIYIYGKCYVIEKNFPETLQHSIDTMFRNIFMENRIIQNEKSRT